MSEALLLDEHYSDDIAQELRKSGHDVISVVASPQLRGQSDEAIFKFAAITKRRVVTENIKDFRPLLLTSKPEEATVNLLLVPPQRFSRRGGNRQAAIVAALEKWLSDSTTHTQEDWLS